MDTNAELKQSIDKIFDDFNARLRQSIEWELEEFTRRIDILFRERETQIDLRVAEFVERTRC